MKIFLSYRRIDTHQIVDEVYDRLCDAFGRESVFRDVQNIPAAIDFRTVLHEALIQCNVLVALIGDQWLNAANSDGSRRLDSPDDWVRLEIETACTRKIHLLPILVDNACCPKADELPRSIVQLAFQQCHHLRTDGGDSNLDQLVHRISELGPLTGNADAMLTWELESDKDWKLECGNIWEAHEINCAIIEVAKEFQLRVIGWEGEPYRVTFESSSAGFRAVLDLFLLGKLDRVTGVHWVNCEIVRSLDIRPFALQVPLCYSNSRIAARKQDRSLTCHGNSIAGFENEWLEAQSFIGLSTRDPKELHAYLTRGINGDLYVHSNFIKKGYQFPTKIQTNTNVDLLTLFANLTIAQGSEFKLRLSTEEAHQYYAHYYVNENRIPKGNSEFFNGATHVHFVRPERKISEREVRLARLVSNLSSWTGLLGINSALILVIYYFKAPWLFICGIVTILFLLVLDYLLGRRIDRRMLRAQLEIYKRSNDVS